LRPLGEKSADARRSARNGFMLSLVSGVALVFLAGFVGDRMELRRTLPLDVNGVTAEGEASRETDGAYRIRYTHPSGAIYARGPLDGLGVQRIADETGTVWVRYSPEDPARFQPYGMSFVPGAIAFLLFLTGMALVLVSRRYLRQLRSTRRDDVKSDDADGPDGERKRKT